MTELGSTVIRIGDFVALKHSKPNEGWLCAEGLISEEAFFARKSDDFDDCLWEVHVQNQYSAIKEYENALSNSDLFPVEPGNSLDTGEVEESIERRVNAGNMDAKTFELLNHLHKAAINEQRLNEKIMALKVGKPVAFGDLIQLRHVKSRKFLTVNPFTLARFERENMRVVLQSRGDSTSCLVFTPRYKYEREGQHITNNMEAFIRVHERPGEYIHAAKKFSTGYLDGRKEINSSLESSAWTVCCFQQFNDVKPKIVMGSQLVSFQDPESTSFLTINEQIPGVTKRAKVILAPQNQLLGGASFDKLVGTNLLWLLEKEAVVVGGPVSLRTDRVTLRDLNTGLFLKNESDGLYAVNGRENASLFECNSQSVEHAFLEEDTAIQLSVEGKWLSPKSQSAESVGVESAEVECSSERFSAISLVLSSTLKRSIGVDIYVNIQATVSLREFHRLTKRVLTGEEMSATIGSTIKSIFVILEHMYSFLSKRSNEAADELEDLLEPSTREILVIRQTMAREQGLLDVLLDIIELCAENAYDNVRGNVRRESQRDTLRGVGGARRSFTTTEIEQQRKQLDAKASLERNQQALDQLQDQISLPHAEGLKRRNSFQERPLLANTGKRGSFRFLLPGSGGSSQSDKPEVKLMELPPMERRNSLRGLSKDEDPKATEEQIAKSFTISQEIAQGCLKVLLALLTENHVNQMHIADRFPVLLNQVRTQDLAVQCVQEMLKDNLQMLQTKVRQREIDIFVQLLVEVEMSVTFLKLLQSTCSCPMGVDGTQRMVTNALFGTVNSNPPSPRDGQLVVPKRTPTILQLHENLDSVSPIDNGTWNLANTTYIPTAELARKEILGFEVLSRGCPRVFVSWRKIEAGDIFSMLQLYNSKTMVPIEEIVNPKVTGGLSKNLKKIRDSINNRNSDRRENATINESVPKESSGLDLAYSPGPSKQTRRRNSHFTRTTLVVKRAKVVSTKTATTIMDQKKQIRDFLIAELYLVADLCLDRNYVAIGALEKLFPFDMLISLLVQQDLTNKFKAPVCRILRCMFVDREPQVAALFPRLIRTSISLGGGRENLFQDHHVGSPHAFALIQLVISNYIRVNMNLINCDELSVEMMDLLRTLINFGFYDSQAQIQDILNPLIQALDDHRYVGEIKNDTDTEENAGVPTTWWARLYKKMCFFPTQVQKVFSPSSRVANYEVTASVDDSEKISGRKRPQVEAIPWEKQWIDVTERLSYLVGILIVVLVAVAVLFVQLFTNLGDPRSYVDFDIFVTVFFAIEIALRMFCHVRIFHTLLSFFREPLNVLDFSLVLLDIVLLGLGASEGNYFRAVRATKSLRAVRSLRFLRLLRIFRAARLLKKIVEASSLTHLMVPVRYSLLGDHEAKTIINLLKILNMIYDRIQDQNLGTFIKAFAVWYESQKNSQNRVPIEVYHHVAGNEIDLSSQIPPKFDDVLLDILMYNDPNLVQAALTLLVVHKSKNQLLYSTAQKTQIIYSKAVEEKCKAITSALRELKRMAEKFEIWGGLATEEDLGSALRMKDLLFALANLTKRSNLSSSLNIMTEFVPDEEAQSLLLNLKAMECFMVVQESLFDGGREEMQLPIRQIMQACNEVIYWFVKDYPASQEVVFGHLSWFVDRIDDNVHSSKVIRAVLEGNRDLIKACPRMYIADMAQKILSNGRRPEYLDMFVGMTELSRVKDCNVHAVENEISRHITARDLKQKILLWCSSPNTLSYNQRKEAMEKFLYGGEPIKESELSDDLLYHVKLLTLLASCNLGPKLQAIYPFEDVVCGLSDPSTIYPVKKGLALLLIEMLGSGIDGAEYAEELWRLFDMLSISIESIQATLKYLSKHPDANCALRIETGEWLLLMLRILGFFFDDFDMLSFSENTFDNETNEGTFKATHRSVSDVEAIIKRLFYAIKHIAELYGNSLGAQLRVAANNTLAALGKHTDLQFTAISDVASESKPAQEKRASLFDRKNRKTLFGGDGHRQSLSGEASDFASLQTQSDYRRQFLFFSSEIANTGEFLHQDAVAMFERLPRQADAVHADVRLEPLIRKLTSHARSLLKRSNTNRTLSSNANETTAWLLQTFRYLLEKHSNVRIRGHFVEVDHRSIQTAAAAEKYANIFNEYGVTFLCLDLMSVGIDSELAVDAMKLLVLMLFQNGSHRLVQHSIYTYLKETDSVLFFEYVKDAIENLALWTQKDGENAKTVNSHHLSGLASNEKNWPGELIVFRLFQLICSDNFRAMKDILREQEENTRNSNILECFADFVDGLSRQESHTATIVARDVLVVLVKLMTGPCPGNQEQLIMHTELLVSLNRLMRTSRPIAMSYSPEWSEDLETLKETIIDVLLASVEGQLSTSVVFERVATTIELSVFHVILLPTVDSDIDPTAAADLIEEYELNPLQAKYLVFLQTLGDISGSLPQFAESKIDSDVASVEVLESGRIRQVYFHIPDIIKDISRGSILKLTADIDCSSQERKLMEFLQNVKSLYREALHQQFLRKFGFSNLWGFKSRLTWVMFYNAVVMNVLILVFYTTASYGSNTDDQYGNSTTSNYTSAHSAVDFEAPLQAVRVLAASADPVAVLEPTVPVMHDTAELVVTVLNYVQLALSAITLSIFFVVRVPVTYLSHVENGLSTIQSIFKTMCDPLPLWYAMYFVVTGLGILEHQLFLSLLLLDFAILDPTTRDLLLAVQYPARQLFATLIIILIVLNVFAGVVFYFYRYDVIGFDIYNMWESFKLGVSYGIRGEYGISYEMTKTLGSRMIMDITFYFIVLAILRHIFFAIIVDTFGKLRELKFERETHANNSCFICGVERHDFDRLITANTGNDFAFHRSVTHNTLHYLYFIISIWQRSKETDSGVEMFVRRCLEIGDIAWFPIGALGESKAGHGRHGGHGTQGQGGAASVGSHAALAPSGSHGGQDGNFDMAGNMSVIQKQLTRLMEADSSRGRGGSQEALTETEISPYARALLEHQANAQDISQMKDKFSQMTDILQSIVKRLDKLERPATPSRRKHHRSDSRERRSRRPPEDNSASSGGPAALVGPPAAVLAMQHRARSARFKLEPKQQ